MQTRSDAHDKGKVEAISRRERDDGKLVIVCGVCGERAWMTSRTMT